MMTPGGHVTPLQVCSGLVHMDMHPPTDAELDTQGKSGLPQTILTSDLDWVPSSVDHEHDADQWFDAMEDLPDLDSGLPFDENSECQCTHDVDAHLAMINKVCDFSTHLLINDKELLETSDTPQQQTELATDFEASQPKFGWLPVDVIKSAFENTTQFCWTPTSTQLKK